MTYTITTPLYYVNDRPHLGSSYTTIACDALARYQRLKGNKVFFITGVDEHGQKIQRTAEDKNIPPQEHCDNISKQYKQLWSKLNISYDNYVRTTSNHHEKFVNSFFRKVEQSGDIKTGHQQGWYCVGCEEYKEISNNEKDPKCAIHNKNLEWRDEENLFFCLSKYQDRIESLVKSDGFILPKSRQKEIINFVEKGLKDFSISRPNVSWGLTVPSNIEHTFYVWFDALLGYLSGSIKSINDPIEMSNWPISIHIIGKDILRFHAVYWPAMLMSAGYQLPKKVFGHGFLTREGIKMGKSIGNVLDPEILLNYSGIDAMRWYLLRDIEFGEDGDFQIQRFIDIVNNDLSNTIGNLLNRTLIMSRKWFNNSTPTITSTSTNLLLKEKTKYTIEKYNKAFDNSNFKESSESIIELANIANTYLNNMAPWKLIKDKKNLPQVNNIIYDVLEVSRIIAILLSPLIPNYSERMLKQLNISIKDINLGKSLDWGKLKQNQHLNDPFILMQKLERPEIL